jgi:hypothetical protein
VSPFLSPPPEHLFAAGVLPLVLLLPSVPAPTVGAYSWLPSTLASRLASPPPKIGLGHTDRFLTRATFFNLIGSGRPIGAWLDLVSRSAWLPRSSSATSVQLARLGFLGPARPGLFGSLSSGSLLAFFDLFWYVKKGLRVSIDLFFATLFLLLLATNSQ